MSDDDQRRQFGDYDSQGHWRSYDTPEQLAVEDTRRREAHRAQIEKAVAQRKQQEAEHRAEQERRAREQGAAELDRYHEEARRAWVHAGGGASEFSLAWPEMKRRYLVEQAQARLSAKDRAVAAAEQALRQTGLFDF